MDSPHSNDSNKKASLENLSKEELLKKCTQLLQLAQKAKQSKLVLQEENAKLKEELSNKKSEGTDHVTQELIENLTLQKLDLVTSNQDLKGRNEGLVMKFQLLQSELQECQEKLTVCDTENTSYKKQINRLTDENEQLITDLDALEKHLEKLKEIGASQQRQLLELEKGKTEIENGKTELKKMLSISLEEIKKLKTENNQFKDKVSNLEFNLKEKDKNTVGINAEFVSVKSVLENNVDIKALEESNSRLKQKVKFYHSKIVKFANIAKELRTSKHELLELFNSYIDQVKEWKDQLNSGEKTIVKYLNSLEQEKQNLKDKLQQLTEQEKPADSFEKEILELKQEKEKITDKYEEEMKITKDRYETEKLAWEKELNESKENIKNLTTEIDDVRKNNADKEKFLKEQENEIKLLRKENLTISKIKEDLIEELERLNSNKRNLKKKTEDLEKAILDLRNQVRSSKELERRSSEEIKNLADENKSLTAQNETLQERLETLEYYAQNRLHTSSQTDEAPANLDEHEELISNLKRENAELLSEMNEMNQAIKERGENISKLEAHCEEVLKKLQIYETQANKNIDNLTEKEKIIEDLTKEIKELKNKNTVDFKAGVSTHKSEIDNLKAEIEALKDRLNSNMDCTYTDDGMSTSTISRTEEAGRMKDLEGSWEERYGKLRNLAVKLKSKVRELTQTLSQQQSENEENLKKLASNLKTTQNLQNQCDQLEDELEKSKKECNLLQSQLNGVANDISRDKQSLAQTDEIISELKAEIENYKKEKQATDNWKKQVGAKIQTLRKELEANNVLRKDFEAQIATLNSNLESKELALQAEVENHKHTKSLLEQSNNERKKNSVLNLEMQDYERSAKEYSKKLEKLQEEITSLKTQVESQKTTINALREQNKLLEERILTEEHNSNGLTLEISTYKKQISNLDNEIAQKGDKIHSVMQQLETARSEVEELSTELSKAISEHQKTNNTLKIERDHLSTENLKLQQSLREAQDKLQLNKDELRVVQSEYDGYKVRAQSVLRQNQNRDVGMEEKLSEEVSSLVAQNLALTNQLADVKKTIEALESINNKLLSEIKEKTQKIQDLEEDREDIKTQFADLAAKHEKTISENSETLRNLKIHADTLSQCYKQQLSDLEARHAKEVVELQNRLDNAPTPTETSPILPTMPRGEGEGSESIGSNNSTSVHPVPLERLLGTDSEEEIERIKKKLLECEAKVTHLTSLLSDTEQDLVKHVQMNKLLKEEIRRQQRSEEREKHAENLEYLKNVVFKFVTLNSGDERTRLVPVLNTILKLSPEETKQLNSVATGGAGNLKGWSSYLPAWSSPNKPQ